MIHYIQCAMTSWRLPA